VSAKTTKKARRRGFTLVELLIATVAGLIVAMAVIALSRDATNTFQEEVRASAAEASLRLAAERLRADLQRAAYMATPNIYSDPHVERGNNANGSLYGGVYPNGINRLQGLTITNGGSNVGAVATFSAFNGLSPDSIIIGGNMTTGDQYLGTFKPNGGSCGAGGRFEFSNDDPAVARLKTTGVADAFQPVAGAKFIMRIYNPGRDIYGFAPVCATSPGGANPAWVDFEGNGAGGPMPPPRGPDINQWATSWIANPVQLVQWSIRRNPDPNLDPPAGHVYDNSRFELVRQYLDANAVPVGTPEIVAEYAVDLKFAVTAEDNIVSHTTTAVDFSNTTASEVWTTNRTLTAQAANPGPPQRIRSVRFHLATRTALPDRVRNIPAVGPAGAPFIYRYCFDAPCLNNVARVRTFVGEVALVNQSRVF
jgi:prepilin-type N-terminal cleavage/methylation domain-containing protein